MATEAPNRLQRFDSVAELIERCRARFPGAEIHTENKDGDFLLHVRSGSWHFESLIVHFEGERCYAVMFPPESR